MNETPFYKTRMGQRFYERTLPELVKQLERLNKLLERLVAQRARQQKHDASWRQD